MHGFLNRSSISEILQHISFLLVNLGFTMTIKLHSIKKMAKPCHTINIRSGTMFCGGKLFRKKMFIVYFQCTLHWEYFVTKMANLLWFFKKNSSNFCLNLNYFLWYLKIYSTDPHFLWFFSKYIRQRWQFCLNQRTVNT